MSNPIYNDPLSVSERFAQDTRRTEEYKGEFQVPFAGERTIAQQTTIQTVTPKPPALTMLMGLDRKITWAHIAPPPGFYNQHIFSQRFAPLMGYEEMQDADIRKIQALIEAHPEAEEQGQILIQMLEKGIKETNTWGDFVQARMREFVPA
jgi:hypothetical protein